MCKRMGMGITRHKIISKVVWHYLNCYKYKQIFIFSAAIPFVALELYDGVLSTHS